ncbi:MAG: glycosyltransferase family 1 protein [Bacteroidia bacterium]|jgi:hypothetical protein
MNSERKLHIVSFDNPYPPNYGGVIDVFYKIKALHEIGVKVILHAFEYGRKINPELNACCENVFYYKRSKWVNPFSKLPYIVSSRMNNHLLTRLSADHYPILFEGLHTCGFLNHALLQNRVKVVRMHNIEHDYYQNLEQVESSWFRKIFYRIESRKLRHYEQQLHHASLIAAISVNDMKYLQLKFPHVIHITAFHPNTRVSSLTGNGTYAFYHGKLSVGENDEAARFLTDKVFRHVNHPLFIAGNNPSEALLKLIKEVPQVKLFSDLSTDEIADMTRKAQVNVVPTFQDTGIKLKLINVLYQGRFVLANTPMVLNTGCEELCTIANTPEEFQLQLNRVFQSSFTEPDREKRIIRLKELFDTEKMANQLADAIFRLTPEV